MIHTKLTNKKNIGRLISALLLVVFVWYFVDHINDFAILLRINLIFVFLLVIIYLSGIAVNGLFMKWSIALFGKKIPFSESVRVSLISTVGNFFAPAGSGLAFRAMYLKKRHSLAYNDYVSIVLCNYVLAFFIDAILGLAALYFLGSSLRSGSPMILTIFFVALLAASLGAFFIRVKDTSARYSNRLIKLLISVFARISSGWKLIIGNKKVMLGLTLLMIFNIALVILGTYFVMSSVGISLSVPGIILFSIIGSLSLFINITPGNLGVKEAVYLIFSATIGLTTAQILSAALIDRAIAFVVLFFLWLIYGKSVGASMTKKPETLV